MHESLFRSVQEVIAKKGVQYVCMCNTNERIKLSEAQNKKKYEKNSFHCSLTDEQLIFDSWLIIFELGPKKP